MRKILSVSMLWLTFSGCGSDLIATLTDHSDPLTTGGSDNLFVISVSEAEESFALDELLLTFKESGGTATQLNYELSVDSSGDGQLGVGDELVGVEPGPDILSNDAQGTDFEVELMQELGPSEVFPLWTGVWTAQ